MTTIITSAGKSLDFKCRICGKSSVEERIPSISVWKHGNITLDEDGDVDLKDGAWCTDEVDWEAGSTFTCSFCGASVPVSDVAELARYIINSHKKGV
jgi:hypothetical protein